MSGYVSVPRIYRYVLMDDKGMAPNPRGAMLTLATCKPTIRRGARRGDWVLANRPAPHNERVVWAGRVSEVLTFEEYSDKYPERDDALYTRDDAGRPQRIDGKLPWYHPEQRNLITDTRGGVLLFEWTRCWYFGNDARLLPSELAHLAKRGIGQILKGTLPGDDLALEKWLESQAPPGKIGEPADGWDGPDKGSCGPTPIRPRGSCGC